MARKNSDAPKDLNLPPASLKITRKPGSPTVLMVYDPLRLKSVVLTPEEYVRQRFTRWMTDNLGYPPSHMANEVQIELNSTIKRCDTVVYGPDGSPVMIVEYKAPHIKIDSEVFAQIYRYNIALKVRYLTVSNGMTHYCCKIDYINDTYSFLAEIPDYNHLDYDSAI